MDEKAIEAAVAAGIARAARAKESGMSEDEFKKDEAEKALLAGATSLFDNYGRGYEDVPTFDENKE